MLIKILGFCLVLFCCSYIGFYFAHEKERRFQILMQFESILHGLSQEISCAMTPLPKAFQTVADGEAGKTFLAAADKMNLGHPATQAWDAAVKKSNLPINKKDVEVLQAFGNGLSAGDAQGQLANIELCIQRLKGLEVEAQNDCGKCCKMYRSGGVLIGLLISILLL